MTTLDKLFEKKFPVVVKFLVELPKGVRPETYIGLPLNGKDGKEIGQIIGVEDGPNGLKLIARVFEKHAKAIEGCFIRFATVEIKP